MNQLERMFVFGVVITLGFLAPLCFFMLDLSPYQIGFTDHGGPYIGWFLKRDPREGVQLSSSMSIAVPLGFYFIWTPLFVILVRSVLKEKEKEVKNGHS